MAEKEVTAPPDKLRLYEELLQSVERVDRKSNFGRPTRRSTETCKEYVAVPDEMLADTEALVPYLETSLRYVKTLKPKPSRKS